VQALRQHLEKHSARSARLIFSEEVEDPKRNFSSLFDKDSASLRAQQVYFQAE